MSSPDDGRTPVPRPRPPRAAKTNHAGAELVKARRSLELGADEYRVLVENVNDVLFSVDLEGRITYITPAIEGLIGFGREEIVGRPFAQWIHPDDLEALLASFQDTLNGRLRPSEFRVTGRDGRELFVRTFSRPHVKRGKVIGITGVLTDVTERHRAEEALRRAHDELELRVRERTAEVGRANRMLAVLSECNQAVVRAGDERRLLESVCRVIVEEGGYPYAWVGLVDPASGRLSLAATSDGAPRSPALADSDALEATTAGIAIRSGRPCLVRDLGSDPRAERWREEAIRRGRLSALALPLGAPDAVFGAIVVHADGGQAFENREIALLTELAGDLAFGIVSLRARADRLRAEEALRRSEERFRALYEDNPTMFFTVDPEGGILSVNPYGAEQLGYSVDELVGRPVVGLFAPDDVPEVRRRLRSCLADMGRVRHWELRKVRKDGTRLWVREAARAVREGDGSPVILVVCEDITESKQRERALEGIADVSAALRTVAARSEILPVVLERTREFYKAGAVAVAMGEPGGAEVTVEQAGGAWRSLSGRRLGADGTVFARVIASGRSYLGAPEADLLPVPDPDGTIRALAAVPLVAQGRVVGALALGAGEPLMPFDLRFLTNIGEIAANALHRTALHEQTVRLFQDLRRANAELALAYDATIEGWSRALDLRDRDTEGHTRRVAELSVRLGQAMGLGEEELVHMRRGALLHDIGKMAISDAVLLKPSELSPEEWEVVRRHPEHAREWLSSVHYLAPALDIPWCHHEWWDGTGYPRRLKGEEIPRAARIFAVADVWDALTSDRPYRKAWTRVEARARIESQSGIHFDPEVVKVFLRMLDSGGLEGL